MLLNPTTIIRGHASRPHREPNDPLHEVPTSLARIPPGLLYSREWGQQPPRQPQPRLRERTAWHLHALHLAEDVHMRQTRPRCRARPLKDAWAWRRVLRRDVCRG